jgi:hypothetical protein
VVEEFFGSLESQFGQLLPRLGHPDLHLDDGSREVVAQFIAAMYLRGPRARHIRNFEVRKDPERYLARLRNWFSQYPDWQQSEIAPIREIEDALSSGDSLEDFCFSQNAHILSMLQEISELEQIIVQTTWAYFIAPEDNPFVTSEVPVHIYYSIPPNPISSADDLLRTDAELMFPLSPRVCLVTTWQHPQGYCEEITLGEGRAVTRHNFYLACESVVWGADIFGSAPDIPFPDQMWDPLE